MSDPGDEMWGHEGYPPGFGCSHRQSIESVTEIGDDKMPWSIHSLGRIYKAGIMAHVEGPMYGYAVAEPYSGARLRAAWWVLTGRAYAFEWPKPGDLEAAVSLPLWNREAANQPAGPGQQAQA